MAERMNCQRQKPSSYQGGHREFSEQHNPRSSTKDFQMCLVSALKGSFLIGRVTRSWNFSRDLQGYLDACKWSSCARLCKPNSTNQERIYSPTNFLII